MRTVLASIPAPSKGAVSSYPASFVANAGARHRADTLDRVITSSDPRSATPSLPIPTAPMTAYVTYPGSATSLTPPSRAP